MISQIHHAVKILCQGGVIAYPTEAVFGLGCDPLSEKATHKLLQLKERPIEKGLILIAAHYQQIQPYIQELSANKMDKILNSWPGPTTWVFPKTTKTPPWISGNFNTVAVRITNHPIAKQLCEAFQGPLVSTSANIAGTKPLKTYLDTKKVFGEKEVFIVKGKVGHLLNPTQIRDAASAKILRKN